MSTQQHNVPAIRFSEFSGEWEEKRLSENINLISGQHLNPDEYNTTTLGIPYFTGPSDFTNEQLAISKWTVKNGKKAQAGDILITVKGSGVGAMMMLRLPEVVMGRQLMAIKEKNSDAVFIYQHLLTKLEYFQSLGMGNMIPGISREDIQFTKMFFPSLPEQQKIASFLTAIDAKVELLTKKKAILEHYKKGVMQQLFSQKIRFQDDEGNEFPEWEEKQFKELFDRITQKNKENNTNVLTISGQHGLISQLEYFNKSVAAQDLTGYYLLEKGDFAYNKSYSNGYPMGAIKRLTRYNKGVVSTLYICFKAKARESTDYYDHYFNSGLLNQEIQKIAQEGARNHGLLNVSVVEFFRDISIVIPSKEEQIKIATFLDSVDEKLKTIQHQIEFTQTYKKGLLQQLFV